MNEYVSKNISTLFSFDTEYSADSVEWCPHEPNQNVFVCGNYYLLDCDEAGQKKRLGTIMLFSVTQNNTLKMHQILNTAAVLDQKWCHNKINNYALLGVANSSKRVEVYRLNSEKMQIDLISSIEIQNCESETLILSLDWSTAIYGSNEPEIVCSDSKGRIHLMKLIDNNIILLNTWQGHDFEAWISAFYYWDTNIFFSGGDDGLFLKFDKRIENQAIAKIKCHGAGVTSLHSSCFKENILASGSYDEYIRLWDIRKMKNEISSIKMPGTLWRVKWNPINQNYLLAACMLGGIHIVKLGNVYNMTITGSYHEHKNISYGADWSYLKGDSCNKIASDATAILGTCSFYDHLLCVSKYTSVL
ncbi:diphthine methyltransferase [Anoplophora glabripennis]|uniref:diphthine methyltransferase n=1 Tax=Anoplophora glabripennis TaxID=217634 RepID=UPI000875718D|nr:diphthine methyltransferase [Anoplophora glabripennis]